MRSLTLGPVMALVVLAGCSPDDEISSPTPAPATSYYTEAPEDVAERPRCSDQIPFEPTYLPAGFEPGLVPGPAPGARPADTRDQVISHFRGNDAAIEVRRPGTLFAELALGDDAPTIRVLGEDTANFGPINPGGSDFIVFLTYPRDADPDDRCASFSLNEVGVSLQELKKVAEGLRPR